MRFLTYLLIVAFALGSFQSCVSKKKYDDLVTGKSASDAALADTQNKLKKLEEDKNALAAQFESEKTRMNGEIGSIKTELNNTKSQIAKVQEKLNMTSAELDKVKAEINGVFAAYEGSGLKLEERDGRLYVMTSPVNYKSGSYRLNRAERDAIKGLAESVKKNPNLKLLIEGHTDNVKVNSGSALQDNWQLSTFRSLAIVRELVKNGVNPNQVAAVGRGESMPKSANSDKVGKAANRRSEVVVDVPLKGILDAAKKN